MSRQSRMLPAHRGQGCWRRLTLGRRSPFRVRHRRRAVPTPLPGCSGAFTTSGTLPRSGIRNQALSALLFPCKEVWVLDLWWVDGVTRLMGCLRYGAGLRAPEGCSLRVQDIDFATDQVVVRGGEEDADRGQPRAASRGGSGPARARPGEEPAAASPPDGHDPRPRPGTGDRVKPGRPDLRFATPLAGSARTRGGICSVASQLLPAIVAEPSRSQLRGSTGGNYLRDGPARPRIRRVHHKNGG